jgi:predicted metal-dependent phosphoesterase TrpH
MYFKSSDLQDILREDQRMLEERLEEIKKKAEKASIAPSKKGVRSNDEPQPPPDQGGI